MSEAKRGRVVRMPEINDKTAGTPTTMTDQGLSTKALLTFGPV